MLDSESANPRNGQNVALVHDRLREAILTGSISGETSQVALARDLGVGRTPLREALRLLQREGLVISEPNRRVQVARLSSADAEDLYLMRISLEAMAARITVPQLDSRAIAELEGYMAQMDYFVRTGDYASIRGPHRAFHELLIAGAGERSATMIAQLFDHAERYRVAAGATVPEMWDRRRSEHRAIVEAAAERDAVAAETRLVEHYTTTATLIFAGLDPGYDPVRLRDLVTHLAPSVAAKLAVPAT